MIAPHAETRWSPLAPDNGFFDVSRWSACWSRRALESLLALFTEDALYIDTVRGINARGRRELRALFSSLFHASDVTMSVHSADLVCSTGQLDLKQIALKQVELEWVRAGTHLLASDTRVRLNPGAVRGSSTLLIASGKVSACIERPDQNDLARLTTASPNPGSDRIVLLKPLRLKTTAATTSGAQTS